MKSASGAHTGTGTWLVQRASAVALALALPLLLARGFVEAPGDFEAWRAFFAPLWFRVMLLLSAVALALHAWVGVRDILMDYAHPAGLRLALYLVVIVVLSGSVLWLAAVLWSAA